MQPIFAVEGSKSLALAVQACGLHVATSSTAAADVASAVAGYGDDAPVCLIVVNSEDPVVRAWAVAQVQHRRRVLLLGEAEPIDGARSLPLPATVAEILAMFKAPAQFTGSAAAASVVGPDGRVATLDAELEPDLDWDDWADPEPLDDGGDEEDDDDDFGPPPAPTPVRPMVAEAWDDVEPARPAPVTPDPTPDSAPPAPHAVPIVRPSRPTFDESDFVERPRHAAAVGGSREDLAPLIIVFSGKGGVAKSTSSIALAQRAAEIGTLPKVVLVDGNRGQGDARKYLRLSRGGLPTIYDAAISGRPEQAVVGPTFIGQARDPSLPIIPFGLVMAPREGQADPAIVTTRLYDDVVLAARRRAQLVIVDTQIMEDHDTSGLWSDLWIPLLSTPGVWGLGLTDSSTPGVTNLLSRLTQMEAAGVPSDRLLVAMTRIPTTTSLNTDSVSKAMSRYAHVVGTVREDSTIARGFELGRIPHDAPELARMLDGVLHRVTGLPAFENSQPHETRGARSRFRFPLPRRGNA